MCLNWKGGRECVHHGAVEEGGLLAGFGEADKSLRDVDSLQKDFSPSVIWTLAAVITCPPNRPKEEALPSQSIVTARSIRELPDTPPASSLTRKLRPLRKLAPFLA